MVIEAFPDPRRSTEDGLLALGGDLEPESLLLAYRSGIFPWPMPGYPLAWFSPPQRAILEWERLHLPRSLQRFKNKSRYRITRDQNFSQVIESCALTPRPKQDGTWITPEMINAYQRLFDLGFAHSIEVWNSEGILVGGLYGVDAGGVFSAESMFYQAPNTSKLALIFLMEHLQHQGLNWIDIQMLTPHLEAWGAREIPRENFLELLQKTLKKRLTLF